MESSYYLSTKKKEWATWLADLIIEWTIAISLENGACVRDFLLSESLYVKFIHVGKEVEDENTG